MHGWVPVEIPPHLLLTLDEALSRLPNVERKAARRVMDRAHDRLVWKRLPRTAGGRGRGPAGARVTLGEGAVLSFKEVEEMFVRESPHDPPRITPEGAAVLIRLYREGAFEPHKPRLGRPDPAALKEYADSRIALEERALAESAADLERATRRDRWIAHPDEVPPEELTFDLLKDIFRTHRSRAPADQMEIGGVLVRKEVHHPAGPVRRTAEDHVTFSWTAPDGEAHRLGGPSRSAGVRRDDPDDDLGP